MKLIIIKILILIIAFLLITLSCNKNEELNDHVKKIDNLRIRSGNVYETYYYDGNYYTLEFDEEVEEGEGEPLNSETEEALIEAIGENEYMMVFNDAHPDTIFLYNQPESGADPPDSTTEMSPANDPPFATFYEHKDYGGNSFEFTDFHYNKHWRGDCQFEFNIPNLVNCQMGMSGNWNDKISSFKMHQSGSTKDFYENNTFCGPLGHVTFAMFRDAGYRQSPSGCWLKMWVMHPKCGIEEADWAVPSLVKEKWGWIFCANMNDKISAISIDFCRFCFSDCPTYCSSPQKLDSIYNNYKTIKLLSCHEGNLPPISNLKWSWNHFPKGLPLTKSLKSTS